MEAVEKRSVKINENLYQEIKTIANAQGTWIGNLIDKAVAQYIKKRLYQRNK